MHFTRGFFFVYLATLLDQSYQRNLLNLCRLLFLFEVDGGNKLVQPVGWVERSDTHRCSRSAITNREVYSPGFLQPTLNVLNGLNQEIFTA